MRHRITLGLIMISAITFGQNNILDIEKYKDCQISVPIKGSGFSREADRKVAEELYGKEIVIVKTKGDGTIKRIDRGFIGIYSQTDGPATFFEPTESVISLDKHYSVFLMYNAKNTYCYNAICYDEKNGIKNEGYDLICPSKDKLASQYFGNGVLAIDAKKYSQAVKWFELAVQKDSTFCDAWNNLGIAHQLSNNLKKAYYSYIRGAMIDSTNQVSWLNLHDLFVITGDTINAVRSLENLIKNAPKNEKGYSELWKYYKLIGESEKAIEVKKRAELKGIKVE